MDVNQERLDTSQVVGQILAEKLGAKPTIETTTSPRGRPDLIERFNIPLDEYINRCILQIRTWETVKDKLEKDITPSQEDFKRSLEGIPVMPFIAEGVKHGLSHMDEVNFSGEYGSEIIHCMETGQPRVIYGNVANDGLIDNLPEDFCVEAPCLVDKNGIQPTRIGSLPPHLAALMMTNINVQASPSKPR